ncbi:6974_t:CDS:2 [Paraglomus brasilianum]|uniref:6974_t:CDS:1 n=1 Tax=Paraglomus brasilianum TaxID=144538 RepID=A0A9N9CA34_9GLOM|nr:6974_t:CDS:2 [Paraglomus brasilianum]
MTETKKILLIGRSGRGKSTLANVLLNKNNNFEEIFKESSRSVSETKKIQFEQFEEDGTNYLVIDTPGIGDTKMSDSEVLDIIAEAVYRAKDGISQVLFVVGGRFDQSEMATYNLLRTIIFDEHITNHTTIARTRFANFRSGKECQEDIRLMREAAQEKKSELENQIADNEKKMQSISSHDEQYQKLLIETEKLKKELKSTLSEIIESCQGRVVHVDNPPVGIRGISEEDSKSNKKKREKKEELQKELEEEMERLNSETKTSSISQTFSRQTGSANVPSSQVELVLEEKEGQANMIVRREEYEKMIAQLQDKKEQLRKEIAEKEKVIRQKVLKHIFNNYEVINKELGGNIFLSSVTGDHN